MCNSILLESACQPISWALLGLGGTQMNPYIEQMAERIRRMTSPMLPPVTDYRRWRDPDWWLSAHANEG